MKKAVFFDLDNTLYDNKQYFLGAFKEIANYLFKKHGILREKTYKDLIKLWKEKTSIYLYLFDDLLDVLKLKKELKKVIKIFNDYEGKLRPYPGVISVLKELKKRNYKLGIITDGNVKRQKRKIKALGFGNFFQVIIYTKKSKPKPSKTSFLTAFKKMNIKPKNTYYIADNPLVDFEGSKKTGMKTVRILKGEFKNYPRNKYIDFEIKNFNDLLKIINK